MTQRNWRRVRDSVRVTVNPSYKGRWQRVGETVTSSNEINCGVYPYVSSLQDLRTVKVTYVSFVYVFPPPPLPSCPPLYKLKCVKSVNTFNSARYWRWDEQTSGRLLHLGILLPTFYFWYEALIFLRDVIRPFNHSAAGKNTHVFYTIFRRG
jgi:hypothetical protein